MNTPDSPYVMTLSKLHDLAAALRSAAWDNRFASVAAQVEALRQYSGCFYCKAYRLDLEKNYSGVCGNCPCHKLGEQTMGRPRAYNGCYVREAYREMVRLAHWFRTNPDPATARALADACEAVIKDMVDNQGILR